MDNQFGFEEPGLYEERADMSIDDALASQVSMADRSEEGILRKILTWVVGVGVFLIPLWFLPVTADILEFNKLALLVAIAGIGLILYLVDMIKTGILHYRSNLFYLVFGCFLVAGIIATIFSLNRYTSLLGMGLNRSFTLTGWLAVAVLFFLIMNMAREKAHVLRDVLRVSLSLTFIITLLQVIDWKIFHGSVTGSTAFNTVGSLNAVGILAAASLPLFLTKTSLTVKWQKMTLQIIGYVGFAIALFLIAVANWWPLWLVTFVSIMAYVSFAASSGLHKGRMQTFALPGAIVVIGLFLWLTGVTITNIRAKQPVEIAPRYGTSLTIAGRSLQARPVGYGLENFGLAYDKHKPADIANGPFFSLRFGDATAEILNMATEGGFLMILAFLIFLWFFSRALLYEIGTKFSSDSDRAKLWASALGFLTIFFVYPVNMTMLAVFMAVLAIASQQTGKAKPGTAEMHVLNLEDKSMYSFGGSVAFIAGLVLALAGGYFMLNAFRANVAFAKALATQDRNAAINSYNESIADYGKDSRPYRLFAQTLIEKIAEDLKTLAQNKNNQDYINNIQRQIALSVNAAARATEIDPADSENWMTRGFIYQNLMPFTAIVPNVDQQAVEMYNESLKRNPANPLAYLRLGNVYLTLADNLTNAKGSKDQINDDLAKAEDNYKKSIDLYNDYGPALYNLAVTYDRRDEVPQAIKQFEKLQAANPGDPSIVFQLGLLYFRNNQEDNAFKAWQQAVLLFPSYSNARWYLSFIYEKRGDLQEALKQVQEIAKFNPDNELVKEREAQLEAGIQNITSDGNVLEQEPLPSKGQ